MALKDTLLSWLLGSDAVPNGYTVQLHPVETGGVDVTVGAWTPGFNQPGVFTTVLASGVWGSDDPQTLVNVENWGVPPAPVQVKGGGAPQTLANNAPGGGTC